MGKKTWKYIAGETILEIFLILASLMIFLKFDILHLSYTIIVIAIIVIVVMARIYLESQYN